MKNTDELIERACKNYFDYQNCIIDFYTIYNNLIAMKHPIKIEEIFKSISLNKTCIIINPFCFIIISKYLNVELYSENIEILDFKNIIKTHNKLKYENKTQYLIEEKLIKLFKQYINN